jgi:UDP-galactopyranose mutase
MNTFYELWQAQHPHEVKQIIESQRFTGEPTNLEEQALSLVGEDIYHTLIKGYTEKQWGKNPKELPPFIIKRLPLRFTYNNNYFNDRYQGIPVGGYTALFEKMLDGIQVRLNTDFLADRDYFASLAHKIIYTGCIDEFFDYKHGHLEYRSLDFQHEVLETDNHQGNAVINYCDINVDYTRIIEHKHFEASLSEATVITKEYPQKHDSGTIPYYPVNDQQNQEIYKLYRDEEKALGNYIFGGRLSEYKYMDMHVVIESAMNRFRSELRKSDSMLN